LALSVSLADLDEHLTAPKRLAAMGILGSARTVEFGFLRDQLDLSDSDLSKQLKVLADAGYVTWKRTGKGKSRASWFSITKKGRSALDRHAAALGQLVAPPPRSRIRRPLARSVSGASGNNGDGRAGSGAVVLGTRHGERRRERHGVSGQNLTRETILADETLGHENLEFIGAQAERFAVGERDSAGRALGPPSAEVEDVHTVVLEGKYESGPVCYLERAIIDVDCGHRPP
jgi:DNA-binding MarR family transcriptional regulator